MEVYSCTCSIVVSTARALCAQCCIIQKSEQHNDASHTTAVDRLLPRHHGGVIEMRPPIRAARSSQQHQSIRAAVGEIVLHARFK